VASLNTTSNASITQALLPTRGMRFPGVDDARVHDFVPGGGQGGNLTGLKSRNANSQLAQAAPQPTTGGATYGSGTIPGGALRPGAIDQTQFKAMLNAASAGVPGATMGPGRLPGAPSSGLLPLSPNAAMTAQTLQRAHTNSFSELGANAAAGASGGVQTLTAAQFAALTGGVNLPAGALPATDSQAPGGQPMVNPALGNQTLNAQPGAPMQGMAPLPPNAILENDAGNPAAVAQPAPQLANLSTPSGQPGDQAGNQQTGPQSALPRQPVPNDLTMSDAAIPPDGTDPLPKGSAAAAAAGGAAVPTAEDGTPIGSFDKNGVLVLNITPDRDTRKEYAEKGIKWRLVDNEASNKLFFGEDGKLGWKDLADLVNPLQHIPLVNIAYRHLTGDTPNGAAELLGAIPFGPMSTLAAIADLAVRSTTGKDIGENVIAMITGNDSGTTAAGSTTLASANNSPDIKGEQIAQVTPDQLQPRLHDGK